MNGFASPISLSPRRPRCLGRGAIGGALVLVGAIAAACNGPLDLAGAPAADPGTPAAAESTTAPVPAGAVRGEVVRYVLTTEDWTMQVQYYLRTRPDQPEQRLFFAEMPKLEAGSTIDVWGETVTDGIRVDHVAQVAAPKQESTNTQALISDQPLKPRKFAFVLVDLGGGVKLTKADAERKLFGTGPTDGSVRQYFIEASYGKQDVGGMVVGPIKGNMTGCNFTALATSLRSSVPAGFDHYLWYFGTRVASCPFEGVALTGTPNRPSHDTWYNAATDCVVLVQEPAHNFGALHSSSMKCRNGMPFADDPASTCVHSEYGDAYDPMGRGCRHMNGYQKAFQGWFGGCNVVDVNSTGTFTLLPMETPCNGPQVLQVAMAKPRPFPHSGGGGPPETTELTHYYVEYRTPVGLDKGLTPAVQIRVSGDIRQRTQRGFNTWFLDMNPATPVQEGLISGGTFADPTGNIKFTVMALDPKSATVKVEITGGAGGGPTCLDGKPLPTPAPGPESCAASIATPDGLPPPPGGTTPDGGTSTPPTGSGGTGGAGSGGSGGGNPTGNADGSLVPVAFDAGPTEGFKDAGAISPGEPIGSGSGGSSGSGGRSGQGRSGGSTGSSAAAGSIGTSSGNVAGGCSCRVTGAGQPASGSGGPALAGLLLFGLCLRRRRNRDRGARA